MADRIFNGALPQFVIASDPVSAAENATRLRYGQTERLAGSITHTTNGYVFASSTTVLLFSVAVPAPLAAAVPPTSTDLPWKASEQSASFDYARLGRAADFITLMTYDEYTAPNNLVRWPD